MKGLENIFNKKQTLSKKEMKDYSSGQLSEKEKRTIEEKILNDEFEQEAMEGFEAHPQAIQEIDQLQQKINHKIQRSSKLWKPYYTIFLLGISVIVGSVILIDLFKEDDNVTSKLEINKTEIPLNNQIQIKELSDIEIDNSSLLPEEELVIASDVVLSTPITIDNETNYNSLEMESEVEEILKMKTIEAVKLKASIKLEKGPVLISNITVKYIHELLTVDYRDLRPIQINYTNFQLSGLPASSENEQSIVLTDAPIIEKKIPYNEYLRDAMGLFRNNNFKAALKKYKIILEQYPKDLNGLFYGGLCYYNINQLNNAIDHFNECIKHQHNTFQEESYWYKALSYYEQKNDASCKMILEQIIHKKGFYTQKAEKLLLELNKEGQ